MPNKQNIAQLSDITEKLAKAKSIVITDNTGLSANDQVKFRANIKAVGGELNVAKNTLIRLALKNRLETVPNSIDSALNGPTAIVFSYDDAVTATKAVMDYAKDHEGKVVIKAGMLAGTDGQKDQVLTVSEVDALAKLPSRIQLLAKLVSQLNAPISGLVQVLQGTNRKFVYVIEAIRKQKEAN